MIRHYDMATGEPVDDAMATDTVSPAMPIAPQPLPRLQTVAEAIAAEPRPRRPLPHPCVAAPPLDGLAE